MTVVQATDAALAVVLGTGFAVGALCLLAVVPRWGAPSLARRISPYIRDVTDPRGVTLDGAGVGVDIRVLLEAMQRRFSRFFGATDVVAVRLRQAGWTIGSEAFRARQLAAAVGVLMVGGVSVVALAVLGRSSTAMWLLPPLLAAGAVVAMDAWLTHCARARLARIQDELPTLLEFLALCLSAGEGLRDSLRRVGDVGSGELTAELRTVVLEVGTGSSLAASLARLSAALELAPLTRAVDHLIAAMDRGAPLAAVLHAQAQDARDEAKRALLEQAGRKEILMLVPLVFLILPLSVLFAVFPGVLMLRLGLG